MYSVWMKLSKDETNVILIRYNLKYNNFAFEYPKSNVCFKVTIYNLYNNNNEERVTSVNSWLINPNYTINTCQNECPKVQNLCYKDVTLNAYISA